MRARLVQYHSNTFVFLNFAAVSAYFGLATLDQVHLPRSTEPNRLRAVQAMTKQELHGQVGDEDFLDNLLASRLIRTELGCLTGLASLELDLSNVDPDHGPWQWKINHSKFSKPSPLKKLVVDVRKTSVERLEQSIANESKMLAIKEDKLDIVVGLVRRIIQEEGFCENFLATTSAWKRV